MGVPYDRLVDHRLYDWDGRGILHGSVCFVPRNGVAEESRYAQGAPGVASGISVCGYSLDDPTRFRWRQVSLM